MTLMEIWKRIGKQPIATTRVTKAKVFFNGKEHYIKKCRYDNGKLIGFECENMTEED